jgi:hypothetical protein
MQKRKESPWIAYVKSEASKKNINYSQALKDPSIKKGYKKSAMK